eukprot:3933422-Rhodomonas_salina.2
MSYAGFRRQPRRGVLLHPAVLPRDQKRGCWVPVRQFPASAGHEPPLLPQPVELASRPACH